MMMMYDDDDDFCWSVFSTEEVGSLLCSGS